MPVRIRLSLPHPQSVRAAAVLAVLPVLASAGCVASRDDWAGTAPVAAGSRYEEGPVGVAAGVPGMRTDGAAWWRASFRDAALDDLIVRALAGNLDQQALAERIEQAAARYRQAGGALFPAVSGAGAYRGRWDDLDSASSVRARERTASLGGLIDWEVDLWGRLRATRRARGAEGEAAWFDWLGGRLVLSAAVAETYFELQEQQAQIRLVEDQIETNETLLGLTRVRFGQGQSSIVDVLQQQEQLEATEARVPDIEARLRELEYALDLLLGLPPGTGGRSAGRALGAPAALRGGGVPSDLLHSRPDLLAAWSRVRAADAEIAVAVADRLPRFTIGAALLGEGMPSIDSLAAELLGGVAGPVFDGGARRAEVDLRRSVLREEILRYSESYLGAVGDVEVALLRERKQREKVSLLERQLETAQRLLRETRNRYTQGLTDYLPVLAAVVTEQNLQREILTTRRELLGARVAVHRALGGPMGDPPPPVPGPGLADSASPGGPMPRRHSESDET